MKNINWWKVASVALMAASAVLSFGHDLIEIKRPRKTCRIWCRKKFGGSWQKRTSKREKYRLLYGRKIQFEQSKGE